MQLAELNIGRLTHALDDPEIAEFKNNLDRVNALAERAAGFVWRLKGESGDATAFKVDDYPRMIVKMSVWETPKDLENYVFQTVHAQFYKKRGNWFEKTDKPHMVFWWVKDGYQPTLDEAMQRLRHYAEHGASEFAFGWAEVIDVERWRAQRCA